MNKRAFLSTLTYVTAGALMLPQFPQWLSGLDDFSRRKRLPSRWVWMIPSMQWSDDEYRKRFDELAAAGIQAVLPQIFNSTEALFELPGFTKAPLLERIIPLAHRAGLQVHAWMWTMPCNNERIIREHPDWYAVNRNGDPAHLKPAYVPYYKFLCPCNPEVREFIQQRVEALAKIEDLDGIHLDYIRFPDVILAEGLQPKYNIVQDREYPEYDYGYSKSCLEPFREKTGIDPLQLEDPSQNEAWRQFRYDAVSELVNDYLVPVARRYKKTITAAVFPNWESVRQQWHRWDLDAFLPMLYQGFYKADINWIGQETAAALERLEHKKPVYSGLFLPHLPTGADLKQAISVAENAGAKGFVLFSYDGIKPEHWATLRQMKRR